MTPLTDLLEAVAKMPGEVWVALFICLFSLSLFIKWIIRFSPCKGGWRAGLAAWWRAWVWLDLMIIGGYAALVFAFTPQWIKMLADPGAAAGLSPVMLGMTTAGMTALQVAMRLKRMSGAFQLGNALSLANVVITDVVWFWALGR